MAFGTDVVMDIPGKTRADMMLDYLAVWEAAGVPHAAILKAMTTDTAALFRMKDARGAIAQGPGRRHHRDAGQPAAEHPGVEEGGVRDEGAER